MQNVGMAVLGLNWRYVAFDVRPEELRAAIEGAKAMQLVGVNLTVPHKLLAYDMMDALDESARTWRAVNTIRFEGRDRSGQWHPLYEFGVPPSGGSSSDNQPPEGGTPNRDEFPEKIRTHGFNTDADAIVRALREDLGLELRGARVLVIGVGGAGHVAALKLASEGVGELFVVNRTHSNAASVAAEIRRRHPLVKVHLDYPRGEVDVAINATSLGLNADDPSPVDGKLFSVRQACAVFDMIYRPAESALLRTAKSVGCKTANGLGMLLYQGAKALEIWSGKPAPLAEMRRALEQDVYGSPVHSKKKGSG